MSCTDASSFHSDSRQHWDLCRDGTLVTQHGISRLILSAPGVGSICLGTDGVNSCGPAFSEQSSRGATYNLILGQAAETQRRGNGGCQWQLRGCLTLCHEIPHGYHWGSGMLVENVRGTEYSQVSSEARAGLWFWMTNFLCPLLPSHSLSPGLICPGKHELIKGNWLVKDGVLSVWSFSTGILAPQFWDPHASRLGNLIDSFTPGKHSLYWKKKFPVYHN